MTTAALSICAIYILWRAWDAHATARSRLTRRTIHRLQGLAARHSTRGWQLVSSDDLLQ